LTEAESFAKGLDQYIETGDLQPLKMLPKEYPDGAWGPRAELVVRLAEQQEQLVADKDKTIGVKEAGQTKQALQKDQELARCDNEMAALRQNNQDLAKTIDQLKKLLIDMESRSN
jgi:DNA polymerase/3'-5' exonuclease PolX